MRYREVFAAAFTLCLLAACNTDRVMSARVPDPSPTQTTVDVPFCSAFAPDWVAFQDGDGAWTRVPPVVGGGKTRFRYSFSSNRGAIASARVFPGNRLTSLAIQYGRPDELTIATDTASLDCGPFATRSLLGTLTGIDTNDVGEASAGYGAGALIAPAETTFTLHFLLPG